MFSFVSKHFFVWNTEVNNLKSVKVNHSEYNEWDVIMFSFVCSWATFFYIKHCTTLEAAQIKYCIRPDVPILHFMFAWDTFIRQTDYCALFLFFSFIIIRSSSFFFFIFRDIETLRSGSNEGTTATDSELLAPSFGYR
jgi:hypothetical protein